MTLDIYHIGNLEKDFLEKRQMAVKKSKADLIMLLNSDISVSNYKRSLNLFKDPKLFAITFSPESSNKGKVLKVHSANGGSSIYRRKIWNKIGGIDMMFAPYWFDDTDYSRRAIVAGYYILEDGRIKVKQIAPMGTGVIKKNPWGILIYWRNFFLYNRKHSIILGRRIKYNPFFWPFMIWANLRYKKYYGG